jgi:geranylgeranyl diphosphate synthase type II
MDNAPLRRGKPTVHEKWNVNTAILSGDVMLVKVYDMFLGLEINQLKNVLEKFNQCAAEVCEGQQWDMEFESRKKVSEAEYIEMIRLKTAVLLGFALELGAILADAPVSDCVALRDFGVNIGIGFQLKDDLLDVYGDKKKFGKQVGGDIIANKKTYLLIKALEKARGSDKTELLSWVAAKKFDKKKKVKAVTEIYNRNHIAELTEQKASLFFKMGFAELDKLSGDTSLLIAFTKDLITRQS